MADKAILWALISASTKEGRKACSLSYFACKAAEAELGLAYMAANDNKEFLTSLSNIMRYKIDAGLSESYTCYLLSKGKIIRPYLKNLNPLQLAADCIETVNKIKDKNKKIIDINSVNIQSEDFIYPVCIDLKDTFNKLNKFPLNDKFKIGRASCRERV